MNYYAFSGLFVMIASLAMGFFVFLRNKKGSINITFLIFTLTIALWSFGYFFWQISNNEQAALFWSRFLMAGAIFIPPSYLHLTYNLSLILSEKIKKLVICNYILSFIFLIFDFTPLFINRVEPILSFQYWPMPGLVFHPFLALWLISMIYATYLLLSQSRRFDGVMKLRMKWTALGVLVGIIGGSTNYFLWYQIPIPPVLSILASVYVFAVAYIIFKK